MLMHVYPLHIYTLLIIQESCSRPALGLLWVCNDMEQLKRTQKKSYMIVLLYGVMT